MAMAEPQGPKKGDKTKAPAERRGGWLSRIAPGVRGAFAKRETPENLWVKCPDTGEMIYRSDLEAALWVTPAGRHMRIGPKLRMAFTFDNGATFVLPASHKAEPFPSHSYVERNATQIEAKAGSFILLDCMMFHAGGFNKTNVARRAVNHVFNIPYFKQQINLPSNIDGANLSAEARDILGFGYVEPASVSAYLSSRESKKS